MAWINSDVTTEPASRAAGSVTASETVLMDRMKSTVRTVRVVMSWYSAETRDVIRLTDLKVGGLGVVEEIVRFVESGPDVE